MLSVVRLRLATTLVAIVLAVCSCVVHAQRLPLKTYTTADGLATSVVHNVIRDSEGFLWFVGRGGISRFDGREFVSLKLPDQSAPLVHLVLESRDRKRFWIASDNGLYRVERSASTSVSPSEEKLSDQARRLHATKVSNIVVSALYEEPDGQLVAGGDTVVESGDTTGDTVDFKKVGLRDGINGRLRMRDFLKDPDGSLWASSDQGVLRRLPDRRWVIYQIPKVYGVGNETGRIARDPRGNIWIPARNGVYIIRPEDVTSISGLQDQADITLPIVEHKLGISGSFDWPQAGTLIHLVPGFIVNEPGAGGAVAGSAQSIYNASDGRIWFSTKDGVYVFDDSHYISLRDAAGRPGPSNQLCEDLAGNIWFATANGAVKLALGGMTSYEQTSGLIDANVHTIRERPNGNLLVGHGIWRVSELTESGFETARLNLEPNARLVWTGSPFIVDGAGTLWAMGNFGLYKFASRPSITEQAVQKPGRQDLRSPYRAFTDKLGRIWFTGNNESNQLPLLIFDPATSGWTDLSNWEGFPKDRLIASFAEDQRGRVWMGLYGGGIVRLEDNKFTAIGAEQGLPSGSIFGLLFDRSGRLWISTTEQGLVRVDDPHADELLFTRVSETEGLSSNNVRSLAEDNDGNIYAGTVRGVSRIDAKTDEIQVLTTADGLAADFVGAAYRDRNGVMWFGTSNGLSRYVPVTRTAPPGREVFISSLQIAGNDYGLSEFGHRAVDGLDLSSSENNVRISFTSVGDATRYQYKIEGANEQDWSNPSTQRSLNLANLSSGNYRLLVRTADAVGLEPASLSFTIRPPFWRSWWFLVLAFLFVGGSVFALDRFRVAKTRQVKTALAKSVESETRFRTLAATASDAIITIDEDSTIVYVNEAVERIFGHAPDAVIGKKLTSLMPERMRGAHDAGLARYIATSSKNIGWTGVTLPGLRTDGTEVPLELSFGEFEFDGKRYFTGIARDITERLKTEEALRKAREERMRELQLVRSRIATDLHDDIGSSLTQIAVLSEVARGQASTLNADGVTTPLERIKNVSKELVAVMSDIVWAINPQKDYLNDLVQRMRRFGSDVTSGRGIAFEFNAPEMEGAVELGANIRREVFAIFKESVNNAVKYSECRHVVTDFLLNGERLILTVADDGVGFDTAVVLSEDFRPEMGGNGLVSIRRRAIELGGICDIRSAVGAGTLISMNIPLHPNDNGA